MNHPDQILSYDILLEDVVGKIRCTICDTKENLTIHHIYPECYGKYNNEVKRKLHTAYLCSNCHYGYEIKASILKRFLKLRLFGVESEVTTCLIDRDKDRVYRAANTLHRAIRHDHDLKEAKEMLTEIVRDYLGRDPTPEDFKNLRGTDANIPNPEYVDISEKVVQRFGVLRFVHFWFAHFNWHVKSTRIKLFK